MSRKPSDLLDFLRHSAGPVPEPPGREPEPPPAELERTPQIMVVRRSQVIVAAAAAGFALLLAFLLGLALGGGGGEEDVVPTGTRVWGIRLVSYNDTVKGHRLAQATAKQLQAHELEEVTVQSIPSKGTIVVMLGAWLTPPSKNEAAQALLAHVKKLSRDGIQAFPDARFWSIER